jgi:outer membrane protein TolC
MKALLSLVVACSLPALAPAGDLADLLHAAQQHPRAAARAADVAAAREDLAAAHARYFGQGSLVAGVTRYEHPRVLGVFTPGVDTLPAASDRDIVRAGVIYALPIDVFGVVAKAQERAAGNLDAAQLLDTQERLARMHQAASAWFRLQALVKQGEALAKLKASVGASRTRLAREVELGKSARVSLRLAESEYQRVLADEAALAAQIDTALAELADASGEARRPASGDIPLPAWRDPVLADTLPVRLATLRAKIARARAAELQRGNRPQVSVNGSWLDYHGGADKSVWETGVQIAVPLTPSAWRQSDAEARRALVAHDEQQAAERDTARQLAALKAAYESARAGVAALEAEVAFRREVVAVEQEKTRLGSQTLENLLRTERDLLDAEFRLAATRAQAANAWSAAQVIAGMAEPDYIATLERP